MMRGEMGERGNAIKDAQDREEERVVCATHGTERRE